MWFCIFKIEICGWFLMMNRVKIKDRFILELLVIRRFYVRMLWSSIGRIKIFFCLLCFCLIDMGEMDIFVEYCLVLFLFFEGFFL